MRFVFDDRKTTQAAARLLELSGGKLEYIKLIKLLYLADRRALIETGYPITGARLVSMPRGPVLSQVLDYVTEGAPEGSIWGEYISAPSNYAVTLTQPSTDENLSRYDTDLLDEIHAQYGGWDRWALVQLTHELPEWVDPGGSSTPIDPQVILRDAGRSDEDIREIASQAAEVWSFRKIGRLVR
ncbi:MAG: Panacea domain-containing protein [Dehalococcoidia bacterium]